MNYLKLYISLIRNAEKRNYVSGYCEKHHIFPVSIFGKNKRIVKLTAREHYIAHALLERIYVKRYGIKNPKTHKMIRAFFLMNNAQGHGQHRYTNSRLYEINKINYSIACSGLGSPMFGKKRIFSAEHLENMKKFRKHGSENPLFGKTRPPEVIAKIKASKQNVTDDFRNKMSEVRKGMKFSEEHRKNLSISHKGNVPANKGKSKILFEFKPIDSDLKIINKIELRDYARLNNLNYTGLLVASTTTFKYKTFYIKRLGTNHV